MNRGIVVRYLEQRSKFGKRDPANYVYKNGRYFESQPLTKSEQEYVKRISRGEYPIKQCYRNSQIVALTAVPSDITLQYVEGYVDAGIGIPLEHAWLSVNGKVVDLTLRVKNESYKRVHGIIPENFEYYGVEMHTDEAKHCLKHGKYISIIDDWECGWPKLGLDKNV